MLKKCFPALLYALRCKKIKNAQALIGNRPVIIYQNDCYLVILLHFKLQLLNNQYLIKTLLFKIIDYDALES